MANFYLEDFDIINSFNNATSVSWEVSLDSRFNTIIDSIYKNKEALDGWFTPLKKITGHGFYDERTVLYVRCKLYSEINSEIGYESDWFTKTINETYSKKVRLSKNGKLVGEVAIDENNVVINKW